MGEELYSAQKGKKNLELFGIDSATGFSAESCSHTARGRRKATLTRGPQPSAKERREREGSGARGPPGAWWAAVGRRGARGWLATSGPRAWEKKEQAGGRELGLSLDPWDFLPFSSFFCFYFPKHVFQSNFEQKQKVKTETHNTK